MGFAAGLRRERRNNWAEFLLDDMALCLRENTT